MDKRVVITGMGVISPVGNDVNTFWKNLCEGYCGIDYITEYPTDELPVRIAGRIRDFQPEEYGMDKPFVRKQDLFTQYGVAAAYQAVHQSGLFSHPVDTVLQAFVDNAHKGIDCAHHCADDAQTGKRINQNGLNAFERVGQVVTCFFEHLEQPACDEACKQSAEEAGNSLAVAAGSSEGGACGSQRAADKTDEQAGTVCDRHGDEQFYSGGGYR